MKQGIHPEYREVCFVDLSSGWKFVTRSCAQTREKPLAGIQLGLCLHVTTETANLVRTLTAGGADVALCASNPLSTQDDVAAALVDRHEVEVYAIKGEGDEAYYAHINAVCDKHPKITMDDGRELPLYKLESTSESHPFYTGTQKSVDSLGGRVEKFRNKFAHLNTAKK